MTQSIVAFLGISGVGKITFFIKSERIVSSGHLTADY